MNLFVFNLLLAGGWMAATGDTSLGNALLGFAIAYGALWMTAPLYGGSNYFRRGWRAVRLAGIFLWQLAASSLRVAWDIILPRDLSNPGIITMPLEARSDMEILLTANLISLTPGTLSIDVPPSRDRLYIHAMFLDDENTALADAKQMERLVLEVMR